MTRTMKTVLAALATVIAVAGLGAAAASVDNTQSAWSDQTIISSAVSAGTWQASLGTCTAYNNGGNAVGTCTIKSSTYQEWGSAGNHVRNHNMSFTVSSPATAYIVFTTDLSAATGTSSGSGTWSWSTAATLSSSNQIVPTSACSALPTLSGRTISGWNWQSSPTVYWQMTDNRAGQSSGSITCL